MRTLLDVFVLIAVFLAPSAAADPTGDATSQPYVGAGEAMARYLTTVSYQSVYSDIDRILAASSNPFRDTFAARSGVP